MFALALQVTGTDPRARGASAGDSLMGCLWDRIAAPPPHISVEDPYTAHCCDNTSACSNTVSVAFSCLSGG
jgi:hypothetical protein